MPFQEKDRHDQHCVIDAQGNHYSLPAAQEPHHDQWLSDMHAGKSNEVISGNPMNRHMIPQCLRMHDQEFLDRVRLQGGGELGEVRRAQIVRTLTRPKVKQAKSEIVSHENRANKLQAMLPAVIQGDEDDASPNLGKHAEVDELEKLKKGKREASNRPVRQVGYGTA